MPTFEVDTPAFLQRREATRILPPSRSKSMRGRDTLWPQVKASHVCARAPWTASPAAASPWPRPRPTPGMSVSRYYQLRQRYLAYGEPGLRPQATATATATAALALAPSARGRRDPELRHHPPDRGRAEHHHRPRPCRASEGSASPTARRTRRPLKLGFDDKHLPVLQGTATTLMGCSEPSKEVHEFRRT